jgi:hypothetical protein
VILNIRLLTAPSKPKRAVKGLDHGLDLPKHMVSISICITAIRSA